MILARLAKALSRQDWQSVVVEIMVVVVGILFALQVDTWNESRKDRNVEQIYLQRLSADLQGDIDGFKNLRRIFQEKFEFIEEIKSGFTPEHIEHDARSWLERLRYSLYVSLPTVRSATFDELAGSGQLAFIQDLTLRTALAEYYAEYSLMLGILAEPIGNYKVLVYENFPGEVLYAWRTSESVAALEHVLQGYEDLRAQPEFEAAANAEAAYAGDLVLYSSEFIQRGEELQVLITGNLRVP